MSNSSRRRSKRTQTRPASPLPSGRPRKTSERHEGIPARRRKPHPRTPHDLDPRVAGFETLRRTNPGDLLEPAVLATLKHLGRGPEYAPRILPMLEDAMRFRGLFDHLVSHLSSRMPEKLDSDVRAALHLFLSWYLCDDPRAVYAHGNAAVELLGARHKGRGFVNALARRLGEFVRVETGDSDFQTLWRHKARLGAGRFVVGEREIFPDPVKNLAAHLAVTGSLTPWCVQQLIEQHGEETATRIAIAGVERPATWVRVNPLRGDVVEVMTWWSRRGVDVERVELTDGGVAIALPTHVPDLLEHPGFASGAFYVQDYSAQLVAPALEAQPGETILDLCSAPGGKATHLAELTEDSGRILACDVTETKLELVRDNVARMGCTSVATVQADATEIAFPEKFDRVLIDAPCSNSGVLARRVEARHRIDEANIEKLSDLQGRILENAARNVKPGGVIVYSVCSVLMQEGPDVIYRFLRGKVDGERREDLGWAVDLERYTMPEPARHDGGYYCRLRAP